MSIPLLQRFSHIEEVNAIGRLRTYAVVNGICKRLISVFHGVIKYDHFKLNKSG